MEETKTPQGQWRCNTCNATKGVTNGVCPKCGPTQTTPLDEVAKELGGFYEAEAEKKKQAEEEAEAAKKAEELANKESNATDHPTE